MNELKRLIYLQLVWFILLLVFPSRVEAGCAGDVLCATTCSVGRTVKCVLVGGVCTSDGACSGEDKTDPCCLEWKQDCIQWIGEVCKKWGEKWCVRGTPYTPQNSCAPSGATPPPGGGGGGGGDGGGGYVRPQPPGPPGCTIRLFPNPMSIVAGATNQVVASTTRSNGTISEVRFGSGDTNIATVTTPDRNVPYATWITGVNPGSTRVAGQGIMNGRITCWNTITVNVLPSQAWWQARNGDVITNGSLLSLISPSCSLPGCNPAFILDGDGGYPGVAIYGASYDFASGSSQGTVSSKSWHVNTTYQGKTYNYEYFANLVPSSVTINEITSDTVNGGDFNSGGAPSRGYVWYRREGDLTINGHVHLAGSRKVILLVKGGNLTINGRINLQSPGQGFFMALVGKDEDDNKGDILIDPSVFHPTQPELQGIFMADSEFKTGAGDEQLHVHGSVVAWEGITLQRNLGVGNANTPAELFEYNPTLVFAFPQALTRDRIVWQEVAP